MFDSFDRRITLLLILGNLVVPVTATTVPVTHVMPPPPKVRPSLATGVPPTTGPLLTRPLIWGPDNEWKLQAYGDARLRLESRRNWDLNSGRDDDDDLALVRTRVNFDLLYDSCLRAFVTVLDARQFGVRDEFDPRQEDHLDLQQAYLGITPPGSPWSAKLGRQYLPWLGDGRLVASPNWPNLMTVMDGALVTHHTPGLTTNFLLFAPQTYLRSRDGVPASGHLREVERQLLYGVYSTLRICPPHEFDLYLLGFRDDGDSDRFPPPALGENGDPGRQHRYTLGTRGRGPLREDDCGTLGYGYEAAGQFGRRAEDEIRAWMLAGDLNYVWKHPWKPTVVLEGNLASGDRRPSDGVTNSFNPLFGAVHPRYGIMDFIRLQNLREIALVGSIEPTDKVKFQLELHNLWLDSRTDAWYGAAGNSVARDRTGRSGRSIGHELDAIVTYKHNPCLSYEAGACWLFPGTFAGNQDRQDTAGLFYLQTVFSF